MKEDPKDADFVIHGDGESGTSSRKVRASGAGRKKGVRASEQLDSLSKWALSDIISTPFGKALHKMNKRFAA